jgi:hypothetical protein
LEISGDLSDSLALQHIVLIHNSSGILLFELDHSLRTQAGISILPSSVVERGLEHHIHGSSPDEGVAAARSDKE